MKTKLLIYLMFFTTILTTNLFGQIKDSSEILVKKYYCANRLPHNLFKDEELIFSVKPVENVFSEMEEALFLYKSDSITRFDLTFTQSDTMTFMDRNTGSWSLRVSMRDRVLKGNWVSDDLSKKLSLCLKNGRRIDYLLHMKGDSIIFTKNDTTLLVTNYLYTPLSLDEDFLEKKDSIVFYKKIDESWPTYSFLYTEEKSSYSYFNVETTRDGYVDIQDPETGKWTKKKPWNIPVCDGTFRSKNPSKDLSLRLYNDLEYHYTITENNDSVIFNKVNAFGGGTNSPSYIIADSEDKWFCSGRDGYYQSMDEVVKLRGVFLENASIQYNNGEYRKAVDNVLKYVIYTPDTIPIAKDTLLVYFSKDYDYSLTKIEEELVEYPTKIDLTILALNICNIKGDYLKKLALIKSTFLNNYNATIYFTPSYADDLYTNGLYSRALILYDKILSLNQNIDVSRNMYVQSMVYSQNLSRAIDNLSVYYSNDSTDSYYLRWRAVAKSKNGDIHGSIEDFNSALKLDSTLTLTRLRRARLLLDINSNDKQALKDLHYLIDSDTTMIFSNLTVKAYALIALKNKKSIKILLQNNIQSKDYFTIASIYSLIGKTEESLKYLELALKAGYTKFEDLDYAYDFDNVRKSPDFEKIVGPYRLAYNLELEKYIGKDDSDVLERIESISVKNQE